MNGMFCFELHNSNQKFNLIKFNHSIYSQIFSFLITNIFYDLKSEYIFGRVIAAIVIVDIKF